MGQAIVSFIGGLHFMHPGWLWAWPLSVLGIGMLLRAQRLGSCARLPQWSGAHRYRHPQLTILRQLYGHREVSSTMRGVWGSWVQYAVLLLCVHVALAQPYRLGQRLPPPPEFRNTLFVVDTSFSMYLRDYLVAGKKTERMTIVKSVLTHFIEQLKGNRIGLVVFSAEPYTLVPLTADTHLLKTLVRRMQPAVLTGRTTDVGKALLYTLQQTQESTAGRKPVLVLISDVNRSSRDLDPRAIAAFMHRQGYTLYTIGIGTSSAVAPNENSGAMIYQATNFPLLKALAERGGGRFFWAKNVQSLRAAIQDIQSAERSPIKAAPRYITQPLYPWPLLAGLIFLLALQLLPDGRKPE